MDSQRWQLMQTVFHEAADLPALQRDAYLAEACGSDNALQAEVRAMLAEDSNGASLLDRDVADLAHQVIGETASFAGRNFGPYRIMKPLGEGGMGAVYLAEREDTGGRVAIKVLRDAWLSPARRERFLSEQRTLSQLNHPSIAKLFDADALADGTPFFVMEYVDGVPLTVYCRDRRATIRERLKTFRAVCEAVQHAHQRAVIHRDLKPSNILATADGAVKLLDFGIAKQLDGLDAPADHTMTGLRMMTPAYAAPEQVRGEPVGVYTDVYSLGVILYELIAGCLPFDLTGRTPTEAATMIVERQPEKPSSAASRAASDKASWAELDVLCLTAMHKDPARRYQSVEALIRDIDHYLADEPLEARLDSLRYRLGKFVSRNRRSLAVAAAVTAVVIGLVVFFMLRLEAARGRTEAEAARTQRIQRFMLNLFGDQTAGPADDLRVVTLLDQGVAEARILDREPAVQAELYATLGGIYLQLGKLDKADNLLASALDRRRAIYGREHPDVADSMVALGLLRIQQSRLEEADALIRNGLAMSRRLLPARDPAVARAMSAYGKLLEHRGKYEDAVKVLDDAAKIQGGAAVSSDLAETLTELANTHFYLGHYDVSDALNRRLLALHRQIYGEHHPLVADDLINLSAIQYNRGRYPDAENFARQALAIYQAWYGPAHPEVASSLTSLGQALTHEGRYAEAETALDQALAIQEHAYGPMHTRVAFALNELGSVEIKQGKLDAAETHLKRALEIYRATNGERHYSVGIALSNLAGLYFERGDYPRAESLFRESVARLTAALAPDHLNTGVAQIRLGRTLLREHKLADAETHLLEGYRIVSKKASASSTWMQDVRRDLAALYQERGKPN